MDMQVRAVKNGWLPFFPQFDESPLETARKAEAAGAKSDAEIVAARRGAAAARRTCASRSRTRTPEGWPRVWFIWRGNALMASSKGHEFFLKHYLGTHHERRSRRRSPRTP